MSVGFFTLQASYVPGLSILHHKRERQCREHGLSFRFCKMRVPIARSQWPVDPLGACAGSMARHDGAAAILEGSMEKHSCPPHNPPLHGNSGAVNQLVRTSLPSPRPKPTKVNKNLSMDFSGLWINPQTLGTRFLAGVIQLH